MIVYLGSYRYNPYPSPAGHIFDHVTDCPRMTLPDDSEVSDDSDDLDEDDD